MHNLIPVNSQVPLEEDAQHYTEFTGTQISQIAVHSATTNHVAMIMSTYCPRKI